MWFGSMKGPRSERGSWRPSRGFPGLPSGLASLRDVGEKLSGERGFRVIFAGMSLPFALSSVVYFINHRYDGVQLWQLQSVPGLHQLVWFSSFVSFIFLYPSTFNLLEVAAVEKPKMHLWETGIMRITRHPQLLTYKHPDHIDDSMGERTVGLRGVIIFAVHLFITAVAFV